MLWKVSLLILNVPKSTLLAVAPEICEESLSADQSFFFISVVFQCSEFDQVVLWLYSLALGPGLAAENVNSVICSSLDWFIHSVFCSVIVLEQIDPSQFSTLFK